MSDEGIVETAMSSRFSRRNLIKAGAIVGGTVWVAPVIDSFTSVAAAASPTGGMSFVTILICDSKCLLCYRMKFDVSCLTTATTGVTTSTCSSGGCGSSPVDDNCESDPTLTIPSGYTLATGTPCAAGITGDYLGPTSTGSLIFTISNGGSADYTLEAWQSHRGTCCAGSNCTPDNYGPGTSDFSIGATLNFYEPPNQCQKSGTHDTCPSS